MPAPSLPTEPSRPADDARLALMKLRIKDGASLGPVFERVTEAAANVLDVERVGIWLLADERCLLQCVDLFERGKTVHSAGATMRVDEFPEYLAALGRRKTLPAENVVVDPRTTRLADAYLAPLGITSKLDAPIYVGGEVIGVLCHEHIGAPREWPTEQRDFAGSMADVLALKIRAAEAEDLRGGLQEQAAQLAESRRVGELIETAAGVAHDFNNVLGVLPRSSVLWPRRKRCVRALRLGASTRGLLPQRTRPAPPPQVTSRPDTERGQEGGGSCLARGLADRNPSARVCGCCGRVRTGQRLPGNACPRVGRRSRGSEPPGAWRPDPITRVRERGQNLC